jgi:hypothetical protein
MDWPDPGVHVMAGRAGAGWRSAVRQAPSLQLGVTVEKMRQASMALMRLVPTAPVEAQEGRDLDRDGAAGTGKPDAERAVATASWPPSGVILSGFRPHFGRSSGIRPDGARLHM